MIDIELETTQYHGGEPVIGMVTLNPHKEMNCRGVTLTIAWRAVCKKLRTAESSGKHQILQLAAPAACLEAGMSYSIPFECVLPNGPASYSGQHFDVEWVLKAKVKTGRPFAPAGETIFTLAPGSNAGPYRMGPRQRYFTSLWNLPHKVGRLGKVAFGLFFMGAGSICLLVLYEEALTFVAASPFVLIGAGFVYWQLRHWITRLFFAKLTATVDQQVLCPGDEVSCRVKLVPWRDQQISAVTVELKAEEHYEVATWMRSGGKRESAISVKRTVVYKQEQALLAEQQVQGSALMEKTAQFTIPVDAPYTFAARKNQLLWRLVVKVKAGRLPKWTQEILVVVKPQ